MLHLDAADVTDLAGCLVSVNLEMFLLRAEYLEAEGREDALEAILMPLLGHDTSDLVRLGTSFLWRNVNEVKLLRAINLSAFRGNPAFKVNNIIELLVSSDSWLYPSKILNLQ